MIYLKLIGVILAIGLVAGLGMKSVIGGTLSQASLVPSAFYAVLIGVMLLYVTII